MKGQTNHAVLDCKLQRKLRKNMTDAETVLWHAINRQQVEGCKFRRQHPFLDYVLDFVCLERWLEVEVDGGQHLESRTDILRNKRLKEAGFRVLRFWNNDVLTNRVGVLTLIREALLVTEPHPHPNPPSAGFAQPAGSGGAEKCSAKPHLRPLEGEENPHPHPNPPLEGEGVNRGGAPC